MPTYDRFKGRWHFYPVNEGVNPPTLANTPIAIINVIDIDAQGNITDAKDQSNRDLRGSIKLRFHDPCDVITIWWLSNDLYFRGTITGDRPLIPKMHVAGRWQKIPFLEVSPEEEEFMKEQATRARSDEDLDKQIAKFDQDDGTWHGTHP